MSSSFLKFLDNLQSYIYFTDCQVYPDSNKLDRKMMKMRLKELRQSAGLTMKQLGKSINLAESTISLYESGKRLPDIETVKDIASFFNVSVDYLLGLTDENDPLSEIEEEALDDELISRVKALSPEDRQKVDYFVQGIEAARGEGASPASGERKSPL